MSIAGSKIEICSASPADAVALAQVGTSSFRDAYAAHSSSADVEKHLTEHFAADAVRDVLADGHCTYYLATVDGLPAGLARVRMAACPVPGGDDNALELQQLYVLADMQRHGLGRRLIQRVVEHAEANSAKGIWLSAWEFADWATRFYSSVGFAEIGRVEFKLGATLYTDLLMWRPLN